MESILNQASAAPTIHVVNLGGAEELRECYGDRWNVRLYDMPPDTTPLAAVHSLIDRLETPFVALQSSDSTSDSRRITESVNALIAEGGELFACPVETPSGDTPARMPIPGDYQRTVPMSTLVFRRATFVDMGGVADRRDDDVEFLYRAACEGRPIIIGGDPLVASQGGGPDEALGSAPSYSPVQIGTLREHARGFSRQVVACDVVIPFHGQLEYAHEAIESVLDQQDADIVIHLIDDASPDDCARFLSYWKTHPQVRVYRNSKNIGQYSSFNNVSKFFETEHAAVQDADDISLPHRISMAGTMLQLSGGDFFGASVELFGNNHIVKPVFQETNCLETIPRRTHRWSFYPVLRQIDYFLENPTAVFRVGMFREMGGYADFGDRLANRASLDTEFLLRCLFSNVRFAISREVVTKYRVHEESATQNALTGWGTTARSKATEQVEFRSGIYRRARFDPRSFGALHRHTQYTHRV